MQNTSLSPGMLLRQRYRILGSLGEGGFGTVYKACDEEQYDRFVAIKQLNMPVNLSVQEKIEITDSYNREVTLLSALRLEGLPRIYDHFTEPEHWYVVMEYLEGKTLEQCLQGQRLPLNKVLTIGIRLCSILDYLHQQKPPIIFRDVKPDNILLTSHDTIYLIDFGIARRYRTQQAKDTGALGSPGYAAPEQYGRVQTTPQTDIYGLGATLQTLLTGKDPLEIKTDGWPADVIIPQPLQELLQRMMELEISKRPESMQAVSRHLSEMKQDIEPRDLPPQTPSHASAHYRPAHVAGVRHVLPLQRPPRRSHAHSDASIFWPGLRVGVQSPLLPQTTPSAPQLPPLGLPAQPPRPRTHPGVLISWPDTPALPPSTARYISSKHWERFLDIIEGLDSYSFRETQGRISKVLFWLLFIPAMFFLIVAVFTYGLNALILFIIAGIVCIIISNILGLVLALCLKLLLWPFQTQLQNRLFRRISQIRLRQQPPPLQH